MKIKKSELIKFLKEVSVDNINEARYNFTDDGLIVKGMNATNTIQFNAKLGKSAFENYESIGEIGVQSVNQIIKILRKFDNDLDLKVEGNLIDFVSKTKAVSTELTDVQFIAEINSTLNLEFEEVVTIDSGILKSFIDDISENDSPVLTIKTVEKKILLSNSGKFKFRVPVESLEAKGGVEATFGDPFFQVISVLTGDVQLGIKEKYPARIRAKTEYSDITYIIAPRFNNEEE